MMTPFDRHLSTPSLQMLKLFIPFLPPDNQRMMAVYVKFLELHYTISNFHAMKQMQASFDTILENMKPYMSQADLDSFDQMINLMNMMSMMQEMQIDPSAMMADMFTQDDNTDFPKEGDTYE